MTAPKAMAGAPVPRSAMAAIAVCVAANLIDGFDVLAIAFTAPTIAREWRVGPQLLGAVFSAGLAGITLGSLVLAPLADRMSRKRFALACLAAMALSMLACAFARTVEQLMLLRFVTGLGVGGILPTLNSVVAESAPLHRRNVAISLFTAAYPLGSMLGGGLAALLIEPVGWRSIFLIGGTATALVLVLHWIWLPPSPPRARRSTGTSGWRRLFGPGRRAPTVLIALAFFVHMLSVFFVLNWTPRLIEQMGFAAQTGVVAALAINLGSLFGGLTYGTLADRYGWSRVAPLYAVAFALSLAVLGSAPGQVTLLYAAAALVGFFMGGVMTSLYALAPIVFPADVRVGGTGLAIGVGRCGGILGPLLAGYGLAAGIGSGTLFLLCALAPLVVWLALVAIGRRAGLTAVEAD